MLLLSHGCTCPHQYNTCTCKQGSFFGFTSCRKCVSTSILLCPTSVLLEVVSSVTRMYFIPNAGVRLNCKYGVFLAASVVTTFRMSYVCASYVCAFEFLLRSVNIFNTLCIHIESGNLFGKITISCCPGLSTLCLIRRRSRSSSICCSDSKCSLCFIRINIIVCKLCRSLTVCRKGSSVLLRTGSNVRRVNRVGLQVS